MKRLERLTALLSYLQSRKFSKIEDLKAKFDISERTAYRDIRALQESGAPISFESDKGYFILDRHFLPPLAFTLEEAKSFIFVEQLALKYTDAETFGHFSGALEKIRQALRSHQLDDIEMLSSKVRAYINPKFVNKYLNEAEEACTQKKVLSIDYQDFNGNKTSRLIEPIGITFYSQSWHLIAFCQMRNDYRDFSLARIIHLKTTGQTFERQHLTLSEFIQKLEEGQTR